MANWQAEVRVIIFVLQKIGDKFITELSELRQLEKFVNDKGFIAMLGKVKQVATLASC